MFRNAAIAGAFESGFSCLLVAADRFKASLGGQITVCAPSAQFSYKRQRERERERERAKRQEADMRKRKYRVKAI